MYHQHLALALLAWCGQSTSERPIFGRYAKDPYKKSGGRLGGYNKSPKDTTESRRARKKRQRDSRKHS